MACRIIKKYMDITEEDWHYYYKKQKFDVDDY